MATPITIIEQNMPTGLLLSHAAHFSDAGFCNNLQIAGDRVVVFIANWQPSGGAIAFPAGWTVFVNNFQNGSLIGLSVGYYDCVGGTTEANKVWDFTGAGNWAVAVALIRNSDLTAAPIFSTATNTATGTPYTPFTNANGSATYSHPTGSAVTAPVNDCLPMAYMAMLGENNGGGIKPQIYPPFSGSSPFVFNDGNPSTTPDGIQHQVGWGQPSNSGFVGQNTAWSELFDTVGGPLWAGEGTGLPPYPSAAPTLATAGQNVAFDVTMETHDASSTTYAFAVCTLLFKPAHFTPPPGNNPFVALDSSDGGTEYARASQPVGSKGLVQTTFTVPAGVTHVAVRMSTNGCTISSPILQIAQPKLEVGSLTTGYTPGPNATVDGGTAEQRLTSGTTTYVHL